MKRPYSQLKFAVLLLLQLAVSINLPAAKPATWGVFPDFVRQLDEKANSVYVDNPFVARPGLTVLSPDPNQLRIQDLRGVECYPQPDVLQVCGAADTTCILLFTKSEERLPEIVLTARFSEGLEYGGFAEVDFSDDAVFPPPLTDVDVISDQNPEAPSFLISGVTRDSGAVYICFGIRAECGADFDEAPPIITYDWRYTTEGGVFCEGEFTDPRDFGGNIITPRVQFTSPLPGNTALTDPGTIRCQEITVTNPVPNSGVGGYIFTADNYGFEEGIRVGRISRTAADGTEVELVAGTDFTVNDAGIVTANFDLGNSPLQFGTTEQINFCLTYDACYADVDFSPIYTIVSACDGVICTGPPDVNQSGTISNSFDFAGMLSIIYDESEVRADDAQFPNDGEPSVCGDDPYVFDVVVGTTVDDPIIGDITDLSLLLRACASTSFFLSTVEIINADGTSAGALDPENYSVFANNMFDRNNNLVGEAGSVAIDLNGNTTVQGGNLTDIDGDGAFDDLLAGSSTRLRLTYDIICTAEDAGQAPPVNGTTCQFSALEVTGRRGCGVRSVTIENDDVAAPNFTTQSSATFVNGTDVLAPGIMGFDFGFVGNRSATQQNVRSEVPVQFQYTLADGETCGNDGVSITFGLGGLERLVDDIEFANFEFDGVAATSVDFQRIGDSELAITVTGPPASSTLNTPINVTFDVAFDVPFCSPPQFLTFSSIVQLSCTDACACSAAQASNSTLFLVNPEEENCECYLGTNVTARRLSRGFTDETRTTRVPELEATDPQARNILAGDTVEIVTRFTVDPDEAARPGGRFETELAVANRELIFETRLAVPGGTYGNADNIPAILDFQLNTLQEFNLIRGTEVTPLGELFSGPSQSNSLNGIRLASLRGTTSNNDFPGPGEAIAQPAFPNGGFVIGTGGENDDDRDGKRLLINIREDPSRNGEPRALSVLLDAIGGIQAGDVFETVWHVVFVDNPGMSEAFQQISFVASLFGDSFIDRETNLRGGRFNSLNCMDTIEFVNFEDPQVMLDSRIEYDDTGCQGEIVLNWTNTPLPNDWYPNEFRPITGIEQFEVNFPFPYVYNGGATFETSGIPATPVTIDSGSVADMAEISGVASFFPAGATGNLNLIDAEFADGVRPDGYANFENGNGLDDITTVGGTLPLIAATNPTTGPQDSLVVRIPVTRLCGDAPTTTLNVRYDWANKHLPDYEDYPYKRDRGFYDGKVRANDDPVTGAQGELVQPDLGTNRNGNEDSNIQFYFPFQRLPDGPDDEINPHRSVGNVGQLRIFNQPVELTASVSENPVGLLEDMAGLETKTITITPGGGQTLTGAVGINVSEGGSLVSATRVGGGDLPLTLQKATDTTMFFTFVIPDDLASDEAFSFELATDLLFCAAAEFCIAPILGCTDGFEAIARAQAAFEPNCNVDPLCYQYTGGVASVSVTFSQPRRLDLCNSQELFVQFFNDGTSPLANFSPVLYIPEGLDVSNFTAQLTGGARVSITPPVEDEDEDAVYGEGDVFDQTEINDLFGAQGFQPGQILTIFFDAATSCEFTSGLPLVAVPRGDGACMIPFVGEEGFSPNINVALDGENPVGLIGFDIDEQPLQISCSDDGDDLVLTATNVGKSDATDTEICVRLPNGVSLDLDAANIIVPEDFTLTAADIEATPINGSGDMQFCFPAPDIPRGGFVCLEIPFIITDLPCGPVFIGATIISDIETTCTTSGEVCTIGVSSSEMIYLPITVVPAVAAEEATLTASCTGTPGMFDINYEFTSIAESQPFTGDVNLTLYSDVNADGELDEDDVVLGATQTIFVNLEQDEEEVFTGSFPGVGEEAVCPLILVVESLGCTCSESVLSFPQVLPEFIADLGGNIALCPGEPFTFDGICADFDYAFEPPSAGTITVDDQTGEATITLNPGFGENARVPLVVTGTFGSCTLIERIGVSVLEDLDFGPYEARVCNTGRQEVDLNIPLALQEDINVEIIDPVGILNPNAVEPIIEGLTEDRDYEINFTFNDGQCMGTSTLSVTVDEAVEVEFADLSGCSNGFRVDDKIILTPATATGSVQSDGDGDFADDNDIPGEVIYIPGPLDREAGFVRLRFNSDEQEGPCGPTVARVVANIQLVDCGSFFWDGSRDD